MPGCRLFISLLCIFFFSTSLYVQEYCEIFFETMTAQQIEMCKSLFEGDNEYIHVDIQVDASHLKSEVIRYFNITDDQRITKESFLRGIVLLQKQKKFDSMKIEVQDIDKRSYVLKIISSWLVERVVISSTLIGKDRIRQAYLLTTGDRFNEQKHAAGVDRIREFLHDEGYFNSVIEVEYKDDSYNKLRIIRLLLRQGKRFIIRDIRITIDSSRQIIPHEIGRMHRSVRKLAEKGLLHAAYHLQNLNQVTKKMKSELINRGFFHSHIVLEKSIDYDQESLDLHFTIESGPQHRIEFCGNDFFSRKQLLEHLTHFGHSLTIFPSYLLAEEISLLYKKYGFLHTNITWNEEEARTFFFIQEDKRISIQKINLIGITAFSCQNLIQTYFQSLISSQSFQEEQIKSAIEALMQSYLEAGFWDITLLNQEINSDENGFAELKITLHEGERRWLSRVEFDESWPDIPLVLQSYEKLAKSIPFDVRLIQNQKQALISFLRAQGRLYAVPVPELIYEDSHSVVIRWKLSGLREVVRVGSTILRGKGRIPAQLILRERVYEEKELWDFQKLSLTASRLKRLGIFENVSVIPDDITTPESNKNIIITCIPDEPYELRARIGAQGVNRNIVKWNGGASPKVGLSFIAKNPMNSGDLVRLDFDYTRYMHDFVLRYRMPWVGTVRLDAEYQLYSSRYDQPVYLGSPEVLYRANRNGFLITLNRPFDVWTIALASGVVWEQLEVPSCNCTETHVDHLLQRAQIIETSIKVSPLLFVRKYAHLCFEVTFMRGRADSCLWGEGLGPLTLFSIRGIMPPGLRNGSFLKLLFEQSYFYEYSDAVICAFKIRAGAILGADFDRVMPIERFYLGGAYSLRCYEADYAPPLRAFMTCKGSCCLVPTGGSVMINSLFEVRFPIYGRFSGVCFSDIGLLSARGVNELVSPHPIMSSLGTGLRVHTPLGALRFDIGFKLHDDATVAGIPVQSRCYAWFLTLGQAF